MRCLIISDTTTHSKYWYYKYVQLLGGGAPPLLAPPLSTPLLLIKAGDVETNPGPTTTRKQVWICDICHRQIQVRKQISIRYNRIEHWVHLRCAGIRLAQYTLDNSFWNTFYAIMLHHVYLCC